MKEVLIKILLLVLLTTEVFSQSLNGPESVVFDHQQNRYLISNANNGTILERSGNGTLSNFASGLNSPKGMVIVGATLYVTDVTSIKAFSLATGKLLLNRPISGSTFLNDIAYDGNRYLYITDMVADKIFRMDVINQSFVPFITTGINAPNGIYHDHQLQRLLLVSYRSSSPIQSVNIGNQQLSTVLSTSLGNLDGIAMDDSGHVYITCWDSNAVYKVDKSFTQAPVNILSNLNGPADLLFNSYSQLLAIPDMNNNNIVFYNLLNPKINVLGSNQICEGQSTSLEVYQGVGLNFEWFRNDTFVGNGNTIIADLPGYFTVNVSNIAGISTSDTAWIISRPRPPKPNVIITGNTEFCLGDSLLLSGPSGYQYQWSTGAQTRAVFIKESGNYALTVVNNFGCFSQPSDNIIINVYPNIKNPFITTIGDTAFCQGDSVILLGHFGYKHNWSNGDSNFRLVVKESKSFSLQIVDSNNCESYWSDSVRIITNPNPAKPEVFSDDPKVFCDGDSVVLTGPVDYRFYLWNGDTLGISKIAKVTENIQLQVIDSNNCSSPLSDTVKITVNPVPAIPVVSTNGSNEFCDGDSIILSGPEGFTQYLWSNEKASKNITVKESDTLTLRVMNEFNCISDPSEMFLSINNELPPKPEIHIIGDTAICEGEYVELQGPDSYSEYIWSVNKTGRLIEIDTHAIVTLKVIDDHDCESPYSDTVIINLYEKPEKPVITKFGKDSLICNIVNVNYEWFYMGNSLPFNTQAINHVGEGEYQVIVSDDHCVSDTSDVYNYIIGNMIQSGKILQFYPNPAHDVLIIRSVNISLPFRISILSLEGKTLIQKTVDTETTKIRLESLSKGIYLLKASDKQNSIIHTFLIE